MVKRLGITPVLSGVVYVAIILVVIGIVMNVVIPEVSKSKDSASFNTGRYVMYKIDQALDELSKEGEGAARVIDINLKKGKIVFNSSSDEIKYVLDSDYKILSPRIQKKDVGDLWIVGNPGVSVSEYWDYIILENDKLRINVSKKGTKNSPESINITHIINSVYQKETGDSISGEDIVISIEKFEPMNTGSGYVYAKNTGSDLARGSVVVHVDNLWSSYDLYISLESGADFFEIYVMNYKTKA